MSTHVDTVMVGLQAALYARELYDPDHPAVGMQLERAAMALGAALRKSDPVRVIVFEDRIVFGDSSLPSSRALSEGVGARLRARGVECITFRRAAGARDLGALLRIIVGSGPVPTRIGSGITLGHLDSAAGGDGVAILGVSPEDLRRHAAPVQQAWRATVKGGSSADLLAAIVADICAVVSAHRGSLLPLAMLKTHDEYTFVHAVNVAILSAALAEAVGMRGDDLRDLSIAALLHDIGKRETPKELLHKQGDFAENEWAIVRQHPVAGARILLEAPDVPDIAPIVAFEHHIRPGGGGYPAVRSGWRMHFASRIVQIADIFDALRTDRPYRAALSLDDASEALRKAVGDSDPALLQVFFDRVARSTTRERAEFVRRGAA